MGKKHLLFLWLVLVEVVGPSQAFLAPWWLAQQSPDPTTTTRDNGNSNNNMDNSRSGAVVTTAQRKGLSLLGSSFLPLSAQQRRGSTTARRMASSLRSTASSFTGDEQDSTSVLEVVLFGVGDLRVDDHLGLQRALSSDNNSNNRRILPLLILNDDMLRHLPGAVAHTVDTVSLLEAAIADLDQALREQLHLPLHTVVGDARTVTEIVQDYVAAVTTAAGGSNENNHNNNQNTKPKIRLHVCDLGPADNALRYGALGQLLSLQKSDEDSTTWKEWEIVTWDNGLRHHPFSDTAFAKELPDLFSDYETNYIKGRTPQKPVEVSSYKRATTTTRSDDADSEKEDDQSSSTTVQVNGIQTDLPITPAPMPTVESLLVTLMQDLSLSNPDRIDAEIRTGLYGTHWGGLKAKTVGCRSVLDKLQIYTQTCQENDQTWMQHPECPKMKRNPRSLEHASMEWQLRGNNNNNIQNSNNWLAGEAMTRYLAAPLWFGTVSPRRVWHAARGDRPLWSLGPSPLHNLVEGQEWHRWLAARQIATDAAYRGHEEKTTYRYWRYHGFLCRYAVTDFLSCNSKNNEVSQEKDGILLLHGFGASGAQWNKAMQELADRFNNNSAIDDQNYSLHQGLAPDMLGFGHSEKPAVSYTGYMWDSQMLDFAKEVAVHRHGWTSYVTGGNSIGGFASLSLAACDTADYHAAVTSSGAPGTQRCKGLVLMNSAGPVKTATEIAVEQGKGLQIETIAQATAQDGLPACQPPPRPVGWAFGNVLLAYLRPRIQSICVNLYPSNPAAVNAELCNEIRRDSLDPGAINVMMAGAKLPAPRTANELLGADFGSAKQHATMENAERGVQESWFDGPVLIAQGVLDPLNDARDRMERYGALRAGIVTDAIPAGHCPHDERPDLVAQSVVQWWTATRTAAAAATSTSAKSNAATATARR